jgi:hypothetical protein
MQRPTSAIAVVLFLVLPALDALSQTRGVQRGCIDKNDAFFTSGEYCYTPARGPDCRKVRFGWGDCPGSRKACDWCYGPNGVFAYTPRGSTYTLDSGCNTPGKSTIWSTRNTRVAGWMRDAGGNCHEDGRGSFTCPDVDPEKFRQIAVKCSPASTPR